MRISDWSSDVCSSDLQAVPAVGSGAPHHGPGRRGHAAVPGGADRRRHPALRGAHRDRPPVRRLLAAVRRRRRAPPRRTRRRPHRRAQLQPRRHAQGAHRPVLGMKRGATAVIAAALVFTQAAAAPGDAMRNPLSVAQPADAALLLVEIPAGSAIKYETRADGLVFVDRFVSMPVAYPGNYGSMPGTLAGDGDPLDALVLTRAPLHPGVLLRFRPIRVLRLRAGGGAAEKIIGGPVDDIAPTGRAAFRAKVGQ